MDPSAHSVGKEGVEAARHDGLGGTAATGDGDATEGGINGAEKER